MRPQDWEYLPFFLAVARAGSLRSGAVVLGSNYGTVNRNIQALEASYGVRLFTRSRQGFKLTHAGEDLLPLAEQAEAAMLAARRGVEGGDRSETGRIRFSALPVFAYDLLPQILERFQAQHPGIQIDLTLTTKVEDITNDEADVSLRGAKAISDNVTARRLFPIAAGVFASAEYLNQHLPHAGPEGEGLHWLGWPQNNPLRPMHGTAPFPRAEIRHAIGDGYMRLQMLRRGAGMSHLPAVFQSIYPDLRQVPGTTLDYDRSLWILLHSDLRRTRRVRLFVDHLAAEFMALKPAFQGETSGKPDPAPSA